MLGVMTSKAAPWQRPDVVAERTSRKPDYAQAAIRTIAGDRQELAICARPAASVVRSCFANLHFSNISQW